MLESRWRVVHRCRHGIGSRWGRLSCASVASWLRGGLTFRSLRLAAIEDGWAAFASLERILLGSCASLVIDVVAVLAAPVILLAHFVFLKLINIMALN